MLEDEHDKSLTFAEYREHSERVAAGFLALGIGPGSVVSWLLPTTIDAAVVTGALARLGVIQNPMITTLGEREVRFIADEANTDIFLGRSSFRGVGYEALVRPLADDLGFRFIAVDELPTGDASILPSPPSPEWGARRGWLYHTSGSTADPKGVWHSDTSVMSGSNAFVHTLYPTVNDVNPTAFPIGHIGGAVKLASALRVGFRLLLIEAWDPERTPFVMAEHGCTTLGTALPFFRAFLAAQRTRGDEPLWPNLRACVSGGAPKPPGLHAEIKQVLGGAGVLGSWGLTEFPLATSASPSDPEDVLVLAEGRPGRVLRSRSSPVTVASAASSKRVSSASGARSNSSVTPTPSLISRGSTPRASCAPATSAWCTPVATCRSLDGSRTSSSEMRRTSRLARSRNASSSTPRLAMSR